MEDVAGLAESELARTGSAGLIPELQERGVQVQAFCALKRLILGLMRRNFHSQSTQESRISGRLHALVSDMDVACMWTSWSRSKQFHCCDGAGCARWSRLGTGSTSTGLRWREGRGWGSRERSSCVSRRC